MGRNPQVSVVIGTCNRLPFLRLALEKVREGAGRGSFDEADVVKGLAEIEHDEAFHFYHADSDLSLRI